MSKKHATIIVSLFTFFIFGGIGTRAQEAETAASVETDTLEIVLEEAVQPTVILANGDTTVYVTDSPIVRAMDSALYMKFYQRAYFSGFDTTGSTLYNFKPEDVPTYHDTIYNQRIEALNRETPIELTYNQEVKKFINVYAVKKRQLTSKMLGLAEIYFPMFEEALDRYDMPLEIKYLAIVESALNPISWIPCRCQRSLAVHVRHR